MSLLGMLAAIAASMTAAPENGADVRELRCPLKLERKDKDGNVLKDDFGNILYRYEYAEIERPTQCVMLPGRRTMSLRPVTSCSQVEDLPRCPKTGLPLFRAYSDDELERIADFIGTPTYQQASKGSPYYLAYLIEQRLTLGEDPVQEFRPLWFGTWFSPYKESFGDPSYMKAYRAAAVDSLAADGEHDKNLLKAVIAYGYYQAGDKDGAKKLVDELITAKFAKVIDVTAPPPVPLKPAKIYDRCITMMQACLEGKKGAKCGASDEVPQTRRELEKLLTGDS